MKFKNILANYAKIKNFLLDILFPIQCLGCQKEGTYLCSSCFKTIPLKEKQVCPHCQRASLLGKVCLSCKEYSPLDGLLVASKYENKLLQELIHNFKYKYIKELAQPLGKILVNFLKTQHIYPLEEKQNFKQFIFLPQIFQEKETIIIPIPLHRRRLRERGFNQSELLSQEIEKIFNWKIENQLLIRKYYSKPQIKLSEKERKENVKNIFFCPQREKIEGKRIILIDDVVTTGATMNEAAKTLKLGGAKEIWGLALARG